MQIKNKSKVALTPSESQKEFVKAFDSFSYKFNYSEVFTDFIDYTLLVMKWWETERDFSYFSEKYGDLSKSFLTMTELLGGASEFFHDAMGDLFMELVSHGRNGQFFTPEPICTMMSNITIPELHDGKTILDPACGSGRMLLSAGKRNRNIFHFGCDIDITCCKMATINLLLNTLQGEIALMDSLKMEYFKSWEISYRNYNGMNLPVYREITNKNDSLLWKMHIESFGRNKPQKEIKQTPTPSITQNEHQKYTQLQLF